MSRILLVEDSIELATAISNTLENQHDVTLASSLEAAKSYLCKAPFGMLLLDVNLPDGNGFDLYEWTKKDSCNQSIPTIFLTDEGDLSNRLKGFELGAQDYIVKPFFSQELRARINLRLQVKAAKTEIQNWGDLKFEWKHQRVFLTVGQQELLLSLTPNEYKILLFLCENIGQIMSRERIIDAVWGKGFSLSDKAINTHICNLRKKIQPTCCTITATDKKGYSFNV